MMARCDMQGSGEVSSANYIARHYGVRAGMFMAEAKRRCPDMIVLPYEVSSSLLQHACSKGWQASSYYAWQVIPCCKELSTAWLPCSMRSMRTQQSRSIASC